MEPVGHTREEQLCLTATATLLSWRRTSSGGLETRNKQKQNQKNKNKKQRKNSPASKNWRFNNGGEKKREILALCEVLDPFFHKSNSKDTWRLFCTKKEKEKEKKGREKKAFNISEDLASCFCTQRPCWRGQCGWALWGAAASSRDAGTVRRLGHGAGTRAGRDGWRRGARSESHFSSTLKTPILIIFII